MCFAKRFEKYYWKTWFGVIMLSDAEVWNLQLMVMQLELCNMEVVLIFVINEQIVLQRHLQAFSKQITYNNFHCPQHNHLKTNGQPDWYLEKNSNLFFILFPWSFVHISIELGFIQQICTMLSCDLASKGSQHASQPYVNI